MFRRGCLQGGGRASLIFLVLQETLALARLPVELVDVKRLRQCTCKVVASWLAVVFHSDMLICRFRNILVTAQDGARSEDTHS